MKNIITNSGKWYEALKCKEFDLYYVMLKMFEFKVGPDLNNSYRWLSINSNWSLSQCQIWFYSHVEAANVATPTVAATLPRTTLGAGLNK